MARPTTTSCPNCGIEYYVDHPDMRCNRCPAKWTIEYTTSPAEFWAYNSSPKALRFLGNMAQRMQVDSKALRILFNTIWDIDNQTWITFSKPPAADYEFAKAAGLLHDPYEITHRSIVARIRKHRDRIERRAVAAAFADSLLTRRMEHRSPLGSYAHALHLNTHRFSADGEHEECNECDFGKKETISVNEYTFRRLMWAGNVLQGSLGYICCDLASYSESNVHCNPRSRDTIVALVDGIRKLPRTAGLEELQKSIAGIFPSNKNERQVVLEILGYCGIIKPRDCPSMHKKWVPPCERPFPKHFYRREWQSPASCWTGEDGVNEDAVAFWFGDI